MLPLWVFVCCSSCFCCCHLVLYVILWQILKIEFIIYFERVQVVCWEQPLSTYRFTWRLWQLRPLRIPGLSWRFGLPNRWKFEHYQVQILTSPFPTSTQDGVMGLTLIGDYYDNGSRVMNQKLVIRYILQRLKCACVSF